MNIITCVRCYSFIFWTHCYFVLARAIESNQRLQSHAQSGNRTVCPIVRLHEAIWQHHLQFRDVWMFVHYFIHGVPTSVQYLLNSTTAPRGATNFGAIPRTLLFHLLDYFRFSSLLLVEPHAILPEITLHLHQPRDPVSQFFFRHMLQC